MLQRIIDRCRFVLTVFAVILFLAALLVAIYSLRELHLQALKNSTALKANCALRADLDRRLVESRRFLQRHPHGISGISRADIERSIENMARTRAALNILDC